jgi:hypothetical protein
MSCFATGMAKDKICVNRLFNPSRISSGMNLYAVYHPGNFHPYGRFERLILIATSQKISTKMCY